MLHKCSCTPLNPYMDNFRKGINHLSLNLKVPVLDIEIKRLRLTRLYIKVPISVLS